MTRPFKLGRSVHSDTNIWFLEPDISSAHINVLDLQAVWNALRHFVHDLQGHYVLVISDITSVVAYLNRVGGTRSRSLGDLVRPLVLWCLTHDITLQVAHLVGAVNLHPDGLSRPDMQSRRDRFKSVEWSLDRHVAARLFSPLGDTGHRLVRKRPCTPGCLAFAVGYQTQPRQVVRSYPSLGICPRVSLPALLVGGPVPPRGWAGGVGGNSDCPVVAAEGLVCPALPSHGGASHPAVTAGPRVGGPGRGTIPGPGKACPLGDPLGLLTTAGISQAAAAAAFQWLFFTTIGTYVTALSSCLGTRDGFMMGFHPLFTFLAQGIRSLPPSSEGRSTSLDSRVCVDGAL